MPRKNKVKFNGLNVLGRGAGNFFSSMDWILTGMLGFMGTVIGGAGLLIYAVIVSSNIQEEIKDAASVISDEREYTLTNDFTVQTGIDSPKEGYDTRFFEYDFSARVLLTRDVDFADGDIDEQEIKVTRFEELEFPASIESAWRAGCEIADNLETAFEDAKDREFFDDETDRAEKQEEGRAFERTYCHTDFDLNL